MPLHSKYTIVHNTLIGVPPTADGPVGSALSFGPMEHA